MKKIFLVLLSFLFINTPLSAAVHVVTSLPDFKHFAEVIGKDLVKAEALVNPGQDPHHVEIKPSDFLKVKKADLVIVNGVELDQWMLSIIDKSRNSKVRPGQIGFLDASKSVRILEVPTQKVDRSLGDVHSLGNPHYNLSPGEMRRVFQNILEALKKVDPEHADQYEQNAAAYLKLLDQKINAWQKALQPYQNQKIVTFHNSWIYFFDFFHLQSGGYIEPKPGISPSPQHLHALIEKINQEKTKIIFKEEYYSSASTDLLARKTGAHVINVPNYLNAVPDTGTYFQMMDYLVDELIQHWKK